jgi:hypothetical protein
MIRFHWEVFLKKFPNQIRAMKYYITLYSVVLILCNVSCKKETQEKKLNILVTEYKTHTPVPGANVHILDISLDVFNSSATSSTVENLQTDSNGICQIPESYFKNDTYSILITKDGFWRSDLDLSATIKPTTYELQRKSQLRVHLIQWNGYTDFPTLHMEINGELPGYTITPFSNIRLPADSTFSMDVYGGQTNQVNWKIMGQSFDSLAGGTVHVSVLPTGTTDMEIKY